MANLANQVAIIVGAGGGIGRAVVFRYLAEGARVVAVDRNRQRLAMLERDARPAGRLVTLAEDAATWEGSQAMVALALDSFGGLDVLVSCVGIWDQSIRLVDIPGDKLEAAMAEGFNVNVGSVLLNIRAAIGQLDARRGRIVVTGSFSSFRSSGGGVVYTAAKHAMVGVVTQLAYELAPRVRINGVAPGVADTVMSGLESLEQKPVHAVLPGTEKALLLGVLPDPSDYAALYALLGSATDSPAMTGTMVVADSGLLVHGLNTGGRHS